MTAPGIELRWGRGFEERNARDEVREMLQAAAGIALDGLCEFGIAPETRKRVVVHSNQINAPQGYCSAPNTVHAYLGYDKRIKDVQKITERTACTMFHELVHARRMEDLQVRSTFEMAATEGLAYSSEYMFRHEFAPWTTRETCIDIIRNLPEEVIDELRDPFLADDSHQNGWGGKDGYKWYGTAYRYKISRSEIIGIRAIMPKLETTKDLASLIAMPAVVLLEPPEC